MKILIGICGLGNGHSSRQTVILKHFLNKKYNIYLFTYGSSCHYFESKFPQIHQSKVEVPWIECNSHGIDFFTTSEHIRNTPLWNSSNFRAMDDVMSAFHGPPDVVFTDYEPISAQFSYATNRPLITLDQQSKFLGFDTPDIDQFSANEERARLGFFFPRAEMRIASSWYPLCEYTQTNCNVKLVEPLLRDEIYSLSTITVKNENYILVYWSPYNEDTNKLEKLFEALQFNKEFRFKVVASDSVIKEYIGRISSNITLFSFSTSVFLKLLHSAKAVITTAGHQILAECAYLKKSVFCIPFSTYEQQFNALKAEEYGIGVTDRKIDGKSIKKFLTEWVNPQTNFIRKNNSIPHNYPSAINLIENFLS